MLRFLQKKSKMPGDSIKIKATSWSQSSKEISEVRHKVFVVEQSKPIGAARLQKYGKIERVSVLREYRTKGIGTAIMKMVIEKARDLDIEKIYLHSQMDSKNFYQQLGFVQHGKTFFEADKPHIEMILK